MNIFVGNISYKVSEDQLREKFAAFGEVSFVKVLKDRETGRARGFGFVEMPNDTEALNAIAGLNDYELSERKLVVNQARPKEEGSSRPQGDRPPRRDFNNNRNFDRNNG